MGFGILCKKSEFPGMEFCIQLHKKAPRWLLLIVLIAVTHLLFQSLLLPYGNALQSLLLHTSNRAYNENILSLMQSSANSVMVRNALAFDSSTMSNFSVLAEVINDSNDSTIIGVIGHSVASKRSNGSTKDAFLSEEERLGNPTELVDDGKIDDDFEPEIVMTENEASVLEGAKMQQSNSDLELVNVSPKINNGSTEKAFASDEERPSNPTELVGEREVDDNFVSEIVIAKNEPFILESDRGQHSKSDLELGNEARDGPTFNESMKTNSQTSSDGMLLEDTSLAHKEVEPVSTTFRSPPVGNLTLARKVTYLKQNETFSNYTVPLNYLESAKNDSAVVSNFRKRKMRCQMPPKSITTMDEMNQILLRHRRSSRSMRPRWSSARDQEILAAKMEIEKAPILKNDQDLYSPLFRNVSQFRRSYELMERVLKIYIYREGKRPIFHVPILKGLYASEGWFMKLMQGNKHYVVKDPRKAHLFYMPFSSRMLEYTLYVRNSHNRTNLRQHLKEYSEKIAAKYRFWNRTGGADHFLVACHDWAPYETRHHMEHCIKALCNADVTAGFKVGRDVSLPETYVRSARNPLKDLGGKPASRRNILAFYAGNMHGYLRPILLKHWKDKDPDMKIFGPMPPGVASKMNYIQHMKSSKYCICPKGYEVNSPRVVEAIFYECVPVIISDNFVPSFFEVFNWQAFSVILAEKDIPNLKEILLSIPEEKYLKLQLGVRKVQRHFLWHAKPLKYDIFHMTLHSIWYNRVYQIKPR